MSQTISNSIFRRNDVVSLVKACGIIFMVLLHVFPGGVCSYVQNFFGVYHMPLFFIMSGFCFKEKYVNDVGAYVKGRLKGVWWPYAKYSVLFVLLHNVFFHLNIINEDYGLSAILYSWQEIASHAVMALYFHSHEALLGGYWFLEALFFGSFVFFFFKKWIRKNPMINCFVLLLLSAIIKYYGGIPYGAHLFLYFYSAFFIYVGHCIRQKEWHNYFRNSYFIIIGFIIVGVDSLLCPRAMLNVDFGRLFPSALTAVFGTCATYGICDKISAVKVGRLKSMAIYIGNNTLSILTWHLLCFKIVSFVIIYIYNLPIEQLACFPTIREYLKMGWWLPYTILGVFLPVCLKYIFDILKCRNRKDN